MTNTSRPQVRFADQYQLMCVLPFEGATAEQVISQCYQVGAVRHVDGIEFCVQLRADVGPELWTAESLADSLEG